jgi:hypothetical protein
MESAIADEATKLRWLVRGLLAAAVLTLVVAIVVGALVGPWGYVIALSSVADLVVARLFATGRIGPLAQRRRQAQASGELGSVTEADPSYNPYARED